MCTRSPIPPIVNRRGKQEARWVEYFRRVLNRPPSTIETKAQDPDTDLDVSAAPPEKEEIMAAIGSGKSSDRTASTQNSSRQSNLVISTKLKNMNKLVE